MFKVNDPVRYIGGNGAVGFIDDGPNERGLWKVRWHRYPSRWYHPAKLRVVACYLEATQLFDRIDVALAEHQGVSVLRMRHRRTMVPLMADALDRMRDVPRFVVSARTHRLISFDE